MVKGISRAGWESLPYRLSPQQPIAQALYMAKREDQLQAYAQYVQYVKVLFSK